MTQSSLTIVVTGATGKTGSRVVEHLRSPGFPVRTAPPSNDDIARVVAAVLADPEPHIGRRYRPSSAAA